VARASRDERRAWATALALAWLGRHEAGARGEWSLLAKKAERWLEEHAGDAQALSALRQAADDLIGNA
jgi:hypothetical protein